MKKSPNICGIMSGVRVCLSFILIATHQIQKIGASYISDLEVISSDWQHGMHSVPRVAAGYSLVHVNLNSGAGGKTIYLAYKTTDNRTNAITGISVVLGSRRDFPVQDGYVRIGQDLCEGAGPLFIYLTYTRAGPKAPLTDIDVIVGHQPFTYPQKLWIRDNQDCNEAAGGNYVYICYKIEA